LRSDGLYDDKPAVVQLVNPKRQDPRHTRHDLGVAVQIDRELLLRARFDSQGRPLCQRDDSPMASLVARKPIPDRTARR